MVDHVKTVLKKCFKLMACVVFLASFNVSLQANAAIPVVSDSRIKTLVYSDSEVFRVVLHYGYQSNIEFAKNEEVETISMGNAFAWQITPVGNRIFLKPLEPEAHTNMTVITSERTYQFDVKSRLPESAGIDEELVYVVRFYYPEDQDFDAPPAANPDLRRQLPSAIMAEKGHNFGYTLAGPDTFAPLKVFDDGVRTFFQFPSNNANIPYIFIKSPDGSEQRLAFSREGDYIVVPRIGRQFTLRLNQQVVCVFNEGR